jgi:hypothetical protein
MKLRLLDISSGSKLKIKFDEDGMLMCTFHYLDGAYSYCTVDNSNVVFQLSATTPLKKVDEHYEIDE